MPYKPGQCGNPKGRPKGSPNKWRKADFSKFRQHLEGAADAFPGGIDAWLQGVLSSPKLAPTVAKLISDFSPKPPAQVQADAKVTISWEDPEEE